ncbi:MAG TPA: ATPase domain-containing protein [Polyangiaceae bacterium]|nr:ATPase domain-containing protein [Polyangiaceae bacterium]
MASARPDEARAPAPRPSFRARLSSGDPGLDEVLGGGFLTGGIYLLVGGPGSGKTVMANQVCFARAREGGQCVYVTMVAESHSRLVGNLESFGFFDRTSIASKITYLSGAGTLHQGGLPGLFELVEEEVRRRKATLLVLDGFRVGSQTFGASAADQTIFLNRLATLLEFSACTALVCVLAAPGTVMGEYALADGLLELSHRLVGRNAARELFVSKLRGSKGLAGSHTVEIDESGLCVYPRVEARLARSIRIPADAKGRAGFGVARFDEMLKGGVPQGSATAVMGAPGAGKTLLGFHFLAEGARLEEPGLYFGFYESPERAIHHGEGIGLPVREYVERGLLEFVWERPFENLNDRLVQRLLARVEQRKIRRLFIDGLEGFERSRVHARGSYSWLAALTNELRALGVTTLISVESQLLGAHTLPVEPWSALVENTIALRYVELRSQLRRLVWIVKVRGSEFDSSLREFAITKHGFRVAETFESAQAVLSGLARVVRSERRGT